MPAATPEPTTTGTPHDAVHHPREDNVRGFVEAARLWARQQGLPVPTHGRLPDQIVAQYRRQQTRE